MNMKNSRKVVLVILTLALLISMSAVTYAEGNYQNTEFQRFKIYENSPKGITPREKRDCTSHYLLLLPATVSDVVKVSSMGTNVASYEGGTNSTLSNGSLAAYVTCRVKQQYSIHNLVGENNYKYARLDFMAYSPYNGTLIYGEWSPDSVGSYMSARQ